MWLHSTFPSRYHVTFRKEGVDWNYVSVSILIDSMVTFRKEGVDWNSFLFAFFFWYCKSPSARKVWIEIFIAQLNIQFAKRHLLQRRCGLKFGIALHTDILLPSPSARKVWIEIRLMCNVQLQACCHLLQGRCGLKSPLRRRIGQILRHLP